MGLKNLGTVAGIHFSVLEPDNQRILWYDENVNVLKYYNILSASWDEFATSAGQIKLNSTDPLGYLEDKLHSSLEIVSGELKVETYLLISIADMLNKNNNLSDLTNKNTARVNLSVYSITSVDGFIGNRSYTEENNVVNGQNLTASVDGLDVAIGDRLYTYNYNISDLESVSVSLGKIDFVIGSRSYTSGFVIGSAEGITASLDKLDMAFGNRLYSQNYNITDSETLTASFEKIDLAIGSRNYDSNYNITDLESTTASINKLDIAIGNRALYSSSYYITDGDNLAVVAGKLDAALYNTDWGVQHIMSNPGNNIIKAYVVTQYSPRQETLLTCSSQVQFIRLGRVIYVTGWILFTTLSSAWLNLNEVLIKMHTSGGYPAVTLLGSQCFAIYSSLVSTGAYVSTMGFTRIGGDYDAYQNEFIIQRSGSGNFGLNSQYNCAFSFILGTSNNIS